MLPQQLSAALLELDASHSRRTRLTLDSPQGPLIRVDGRDYLAFASNDYLGLANHPALVEAARGGLERWGLGGGASHLVAGHFGAHQSAEDELAAFVGTPAALLFGSGYAANLAVITSLMGRDDAVFADRLNHASLNDACLLSRASFKRFRHNDLDHLESLLKATPAKSRLIAVDAVYSMDGDEAPLRELLQLAERYDAWLYLDDAHGFGVFGDGRGSMAEQGIAGERVIYMATLGKAAGVAGAFVAGSSELVDWLVNKARTYIFTTAQPPALAEAVRASLSLIAGEPWRRERLKQHIEMLRHTLSAIKYPLQASRSPIQPLMIGGNEQVMTLSTQLRAVGLWVPAIRPPTVPEGSARLRISLSAAHDAGQVQRLADAIVAMS